MNPTSSLSGTQLGTYHRIFQHPLSHNLEWRDVYALLEHLGHVEQESNGNRKVTRNGESLVLHPSRRKDVSEPGEIMSLRHFILRSEQRAPAVAN